jgi:hypothetical protein
LSPSGTDIPSEAKPRTETVKQMQSVATRKTTQSVKPNVADVFPFKKMILQAALDSKNSTKRKDFLQKKKESKKN